MADDPKDPHPGGASGDHPEFAPFPVLVSPTTDGRGKNTIRMDLIPVGCWKLENLRFQFGSSFVLPESRDEFSDLAQLRKKHAGAPLSVFGHADPVSDDTFNKDLSGRRADSVYGILTRDTARWERLYKTASSGDGWGIEAIQRMLGAVGSDPGPVTGSMNAQTRTAVQDFQGKNGLGTDGDPGPKTREKLFLAYMEFLHPEKVEKTEFLGKGVDGGGKGDVQGCGEFNPLLSFSSTEDQEFKRPENKAKRDSDNEVNRRVMVLLFRPGTSVSIEKWPCPRTTEGTAGCKRRFWSDGEQRRTPHTERREFAKSQDTFACRFYHRLVASSPCEGVEPVPDTVKIRLFDRQARPLPFAPCVLNEPGQAPRALRAAADAFVTIQPTAVPATVTVKWSRPSSGDNASSPPPNVAGPFEFTLDVAVEIADADSDEAALTRLKNLGYPLTVAETHMEQADCIRAFQVDYRPRFSGIVVDGTLNAETKSAIRTVHDACDPVLKGTGITPR